MYRLLLILSTYILTLRLNSTKKTVQICTIYTISVRLISIYYFDFLNWNLTFHFSLFLESWCCSATFFASSSVRYNLLSRTRVPEAPTITIWKSNSTEATSLTTNSSFLDKDRRGNKVNNITFIKLFQIIIRFNFKCVYKSNFLENLFYKVSHQYLIVKYIH